MCIRDRPFIVLGTGEGGSFKSGNFIATGANDGEGIVTSNCDLGEAMGEIMGITLVLFPMSIGMVTTCCDQ